MDLVPDEPVDVDLGGPGDVPRVDETTWLRVIAAALDPTPAPPESLDELVPVDGAADNDPFGAEGDAVEDVDTHDDAAFGDHEWQLESDAPDDLTDPPWQDHDPDPGDHL